MTYIIKHF